jgi:hypothetical protein
MSHSELTHLLSKMEDKLAIPGTGMHSPALSFASVVRCGACKSKVFKVCLDFRNLLECVGVHKNTVQKHSKKI